MRLHQSRLKSKQPVSDEFFHASLEGISFICERFNFKIKDVDVEGVSCFPPVSIYLATREQETLWRETGDERCREARDTMVVMLGYFGERWGSARKYMRMLEGEIEDL